MTKNILALEFLALYCFAWAALVPPAQAQFVCTVTGETHIGTNIYFSFAGFSTGGNNCWVAAKTFPDTSYGYGHIAFLRSVDGGHTWKAQNPGVNDTLAGITRIVQIDSLNIIAYGNSNQPSFHAILIGTTNGGRTWQQDSVPTRYQINDLSFSSPTHGILASADGPFLTSDGGAHWSTVAIPKGTFWQCHDYGGGVYRGLHENNQRVYTVRDGSSIVDSTPPIIADSSRRSLYIFEYCSFGSGDTMIAYGWHRTSATTEFPSIARSTDAGQAWSVVFDDTTATEGYVASVSDINSDTIVAGVTGWLNHALWSTDNGATWQIDSLLCNDTNFAAYQTAGIGLNSKGELAGAYAGPFVSGHPWLETLIVGRRVTSGVISVERKHAGPQVFPNPAESTIQIRGLVAGRTLCVSDRLGRKVLGTLVPMDGNLILDISSIPPGLYVISDDSSKIKFIKE